MLITDYDVVGSIPDLTSLKVRINAIVNAVNQVQSASPALFNYGVNAVVPTAAWQSSGVDPNDANIDAAVIPTGTGALLAAIPDGTIVGGNKRGANAVDLQTNRTAATQVASGASAFAAGGGSTASAQNSVAVGTATATALGAIAIGGAIGYNTTTASGQFSAAIGIGHTASAQYATAIGANGKASGIASTTLGINANTNGISGQVADGHNSPASGKFQRTRTQLYATTASTSATRATADGTSGAASNQLTLRANSAYRVQLRAVARDSTNNTDAKEWITDILITKGATAASVAIVGAPTVTSTFATAGASGWLLAV